LEANDGDAGLELALSNRPELILCDLLMPKSNGFEVCRCIREKLQPTKIIVVSGRDYGVDRTSAIEAGADEYLLKPFTWELLSSTIDRLLPEIPRRPEPKSVPERESVPARIRLWGVRGSIPVPGKSTVRYGGNTSCVEVRADGEIIILDAGSGIRLLGLALDKEFGPRSMKLTLLISHTHWDHIQGLPFFSPAYDQKNLIRVLGYEGARAGLAKILASQMETPFFPVSLRQLPSHLAIEELKEMEFRVGAVKVRSKFANHPGICVGYRLATSSGSIAYFPDNEPYEELKLQLASRDGITEEEARNFAGADGVHHVGPPTEGGAGRAAADRLRPAREVGLDAVNDSLILESFIYFLIEQHFKGTAIELDLIKLYHEVALQTQLVVLARTGVGHR